MADPAEQLQAFYLSGFGIETFDHFPNIVGLTKGSCIAVVRPTMDGLQMIGQPGWQMGDLLGVLVEKEGRKVFQAKHETLPATEEKLTELESFRNEVEALMSSWA